MTERGFVMEMARRDFIKRSVAAATVAAASMGGVALAEEAQQPTVVAHTWDVAPEPIADSDIVQTYDCDVCVVGLGNAGVCATYAAAKAGAKVVAIERSVSFTCAGAAFAGLNTKAMQEAGAEPIDRGLYIRTIMQYSNYKNSQRLLNNWADNVDRVIDELWEMSSQTDAGAFTFGPGGHTDPDPFYCEFPTHFFNTIWKIPLFGEMLDYAVSETGSTILYEAPIAQLVKDGERVVGVIAQTADGYVKVNAANGVIIATGDYQGNDEMVDAWSPSIKAVHGTTWPTQAPDINDGGGILAGLWAGGAVQRSTHAPMIHPIYDGGWLFTCGFLRVNRYGQRFANENLPQATLSNAIMNAPGHEVWTIFDANFGEQLPQMSYNTQSIRTGAGPFYTLPFLDALPEDWTDQQYLDYSIEKGEASKADTLEELAEMIGVPADAFVQTVERYNELVELGEDPDFGKDPADLQPIVQPPFYASHCVAQLLCMTSGLSIDEHYRVLDAQDDPIEGLFAVGNASGNFYANDYPVPCQGNSTSRCVVQGWCCGEALGAGELPHA